MGGALIAGPCFLVAQVLYSTETFNVSPQAPRLNSHHPPTGQRQWFVWQALQKNGWEDFLRRAPVLWDWVNRVKIPDSVMTLSPSDSREEKIIKGAYAILKQYHLSKLEKAASHVVSKLPQGFVASVETTVKLANEGLDLLKRGILPFLYLGEGEGASPLDILNVSAVFLASGEIKKAWAEYKAELRERYMWFRQRRLLWSAAFS